MTMMTLGERLRFARKAAGFSLNKTKELTGITTYELSLFENGERLPPGEVLVTLSKIYKVDTTYFSKPTQKDITRMAWNQAPKKLLKI